MGINRTWGKFSSLPTKIKNTKMRNRNRKRKLLVKQNKVTLVGGSCQCFDTLRTEVDQIPEIRKAHVCP